MRFQLIVCKVLQKEAYFCAARCGNIIDIVLMEQGLHTEPDKLRCELQNALSRTTDKQGNPYDASLLGYGLCGKGIVGLSAKIPLIVPRAHDCITLLLGSKERFRKYFDSHSGTYWYSPGWIETGTGPGRERSENMYEIFRQKYDEAKARRLVEIEQEWIKKYSRAVYIDWGQGNNSSYIEYTKNSAATLGWEYEQLVGDSGLLQRLLDGPWQDSEFLIVKPGQKINEDITSEGIIKAE